ncbi:LAQU0S20e01134g1_1 [Lachancea quebecensis]|uniref:LAQU0S20e01134g1_1 n=1 Tax=Lachancea quebecensis TaxID=1654605 RepID=A0A0P1KX96_9SACH|nr:LAQU0S20e01134g1_1 [Lachancea quebecensis]
MNDASNKWPRSPATHELASKTFKRTPNGIIFTEDLKRVYAILLICLDLKQKPNISHKVLLAPFQKVYPYSFSLKDAITKMADLALEVNMNTTTVSVSYAIQPELACRILKTFMDAKLLHIPADRTRCDLKSGVAIQPTPKGVAVLQWYVRQAGLKNLPPILRSNLNSMELFCFERSSMTDAIVHSDYFVSLLFKKLMGPYCNVWSPDKCSDELPVLTKLLECADDTFTFEDFNDIWNTESDQDPDVFHFDSAFGKHKTQKKQRVSPLAHRFFTNPDSTSHVQYYVSTSGLRLFKPTTFKNDSRLYECVFSTKAIWQWLMDCTDILYPKEAVTISSLFLKNGLITPIMLEPSENRRNKFAIGSKCFFTMGDLGWETVQWNRENDVGAIQKDQKGLSSSCNIPGGTGIYRQCITKSHSDSTLNSSSAPRAGQRYLMDLNHILRDPGMRYLFRTHLESEFCAENLDVYIEIKKFLKRMTVLKSLIEARTSREQGDQTPTKKSKHFSHLVTNTINSALFRQANECLETAYQIYSSFITSGSPYQLNLDHALRESITEVIMHPQPRMFVSFSEQAAVTENFVELPHDNEGIPLERTSLRLDTHVTKNERACSTIESKGDQQTSNTVASTLASRAQASENENETNDVADNSLPSILKTLKLIYPLFEKVARSMYHLMSVDSLPKFINSEIYQEAAVMLNIEAKIA